MKKKTLLKLLAGIAGLALLVKLVVITVAEPWAEKKIRAALNAKNSDYIVEIEHVHIFIFSGSIELEAIKLYSKQDTGTNHHLYGEIARIKFAGISRLKALFRNYFDIREIFITDSKIRGTLPPRKEGKKPPLVSPVNVRIGKIQVDNLDLAVKKSGSSKSFLLKNANLKLHEVQVLKKDTLSAGIAEKLDFNFRELLLITPDSMYCLALKAVDYDAATAIFSIDSFLIQPNYKDYDFTARHKFETDRIDGKLVNIAVLDFSVADYLKSGDLKIAYLEIEKMDLDVFRDKRKIIPSFTKPTFQQLIYDFPGLLNVDSVGVLSGDIVYREHAEEANQAGKISFNKIKTKIYNITNDSIYKTKNKFLELESEALVMGKSKITIAIKAKLFDPYHTFFLTGHLSAMGAKALNPMLENNAFLFVTSGEIEAMDFRFKANNASATGTMTLRYRELDIAIKNKQTDDTTGLKANLLSTFADLKIMDSNPIPGEALRTGIIDYKRDPKRFIFNYAFKAILSGIKSSLLKKPKKKK